ncbi:MAG: ABC transporter permease [Actinobacteria bacterium]|nr:ABC transporter permease [Actinomycetota bacterium]
MNQVGTDAKSLKQVRKLFGNQQFLLLLVWFAMVAFFTAFNSIFFSMAVFGNILLDWAPVVLIALGQTFVIISGGIDLSVGSTVGLSGVVAAFQMQHMMTNGDNQWLAIAVGTLVAALVGIAVGLVNGFLITKTKVVPFIATLVTMGAAAGLAIVYSGGAPVGGGPDKAIELSVPWFGPFSTPGLIVVGIVIICGLFLHLARFGRYTYAIGSNEFAARTAGINVNRHYLKVYALSGLLAGLAGMFFYCRLGSGAPTSGYGGELDAIAAVVIGGAALTGGIGRISGTVLGALILTTTTSGLIIIGVAPDWKQVVVAILIAAAVLLQGNKNGSRGGSK